MDSLVTEVEGKLVAASPPAQGRLLNGSIPSALLEIYSPSNLLKLYSEEHRRAERRPLRIPHRYWAPPARALERRPTLSRQRRTPESKLKEPVWGTHLTIANPIT